MNGFEFIHLFAVFQLYNGYWLCINNKNSIKSWSKLVTKLSSNTQNIYMEKKTQLKNSYFLRESIYSIHVLNIKMWCFMEKNQNINITFFFSTSNNIEMTKQQRCPYVAFSSEVKSIAQLQTRDRFTLVIGYEL